MKLFIDGETYSELDLKSVGTYRYAANCEVMLVTWAVDDGPVQVWDLTAEPLIPHELAEAVYCGEHKLIAHNAMFDRVVFDNTCTIETKISDWRCTMVQAFSHGLPGSLDKLCEIYKLGADKAKIKDGRRLIQLFCKPRPKNSKIRRATRDTHPEDWQRFIEYAKSDIEAMRVLHKKMPKWNYPREPELSLWHLDQVINDRGVMIDRTMAESVLRAVDRAKLTLADETKEMTGGELASTTQVQATIDYVLREHGVVLDGMTKAQVSKALDDDDIPEPVKELLRVRQQAGSSSTAKYTALLKRANDDDRFRGGIQFAGAARTRRAGGRGFQPQNLPSRGLLPDWLIDEGIELMKLDAEDLVFPNVMHLASSAIRKTLIAAPGKKLCVSDLSNIEGRKVAWYANEEWKLQAFRDFDAGTGHDLYNLAYANSFNVPVESVAKDQRAIGKVMELACFHPDTRVLTNNGIKRIIEVLITDKLWDGVEWVRHKGVIAKGVRPVVRVGGTDITPDHLILIGKTWTPVKSIVSDENTLSQALATGSEALKSLAIRTQLQVMWRIKCLRAVRAVKKIIPDYTTCAPVGPPNVENAPSSAKDGTERSYTATRTSYRMSGNVLDCLRDYLRPSLDAIRRITGNGTPMGGEALPFTNPGGVTRERFCDTPSPCPTGATRAWKWTGEIIIKVMNRVISNLLQKEITTETAGQLEKCKNESQNLSPVYDIAHAGSRNRFTVITDNGALVVHNCGYSGGVGAFCTMASGYGFDLEKLADDIFETLPKNQVEEAYSFLEWCKDTKRPRYALSDKAFVTVDTLKRLWRLSNSATVDLWAKIQNAAELAILTKEPQTVDKLTFETKGAWLRVRLASGRYLCYPFAKYDSEKGLSYYGIDQYTRQWQEIRTYSGKLLENICQSSARDVLYDSMPRAEEAGFPIVLHVHDELVTETEKHKTVAELSQIMATGEPWTKGLPLAAAGFESLRYRK